MQSCNRTHYLRWIVPLILIAVFWSCSSPEKQRYKDALKLKNSGKIYEALQILDDIQTDDKKLQSQISLKIKEIHQQLYNDALLLKSEGKYAEALRMLDKINTDDETLQSQIASQEKEIKALQQYNQVIMLKEQHKYAEALQLLDKIQTDDKKLQSQISLKIKEIHQQLYNDALLLKSEGKYAEALQVLDKINSDDETLQSQTANLKKEIKRSILKDITPQFPGPASRVLVMESPDEHYTYLVTDAGAAGRRFNCKGSKEAKVYGRCTLYFFPGTALDVEYGVPTSIEGDLRIEFKNYEYKAEFSARFVLEGKEPTITFGGGDLVVYVKRLEDVERFLPIASASGERVGAFRLYVKPAIWTEGSEHILVGNMEFLGYQVSSDHEYPLVFKMVKDMGYVYLCGRGTVTTKDGKTYRLGYEDTVDTWLPLLKSDDQLDREGAAQALGWLAKTKEDKDKAIPALIEALKDDAMEIRRNSAEALGRINDPRGRDALNQVLKEDEEDWVREVAEESIGLIEVKEAAAKLADEDKKAIAELTEGLKNKWFLVCRTAAENLVKSGEEAVEALIATLKDQDDAVRKNVAKALGEIGEKRMLEPLQEALKSEKEEEAKRVMEEAITKLQTH